MTVEEAFHLNVWHVIELTARFQVMIIPLGFAFTGRTSQYFLSGLTTVTSITYVFEIRFAFGAIPSVVTIVVPVEARLITSFVNGGIFRFRSDFEPPLCGLIAYPGGSL